MKKHTLFSFPYSILFFLSMLIFSVAACDKNDNADCDCDASLRPIIMAHGFLASGDTYAKQVMRFTTNGYCADRLFAYDWNTLNQEDIATTLDAFVDDVLTKTGATQVDLTGHSAGGGLGYTYLADSARAAKVAHYAHIASFAQDQAAGPSGNVPTLNIWSEADLIIEDKGDISGATNLKLTDADHYEVATSVAAFEAMYRFFNNDQAPRTTTIEADNDIQLSGRVVTLGENIPEAGATIRIYQVNPENGFRLDDIPDISLTTDEQGYWGPWAGATDAYYEFRVQPSQVGSLPITYFREPTIRSNPLVYLRTFPPPTSTVGLLFNAIPRDSLQTVLTIFTASQAVVHGRDELMVNDLTLSTEALSSADQTIIAFFLYDTNNDQQTSGNTNALFSLTPFLNGADVHLSPNPPQTASLMFNGRTLNVRTNPSNDGPVIAVFD